MTDKGTRNGARIYHFGYDPANGEFILWKRGRSTPLARIPFADAVDLAATVEHVQAVRT